MPYFEINNLSKNTTRIEQNNEEKSTLINSKGKTLETRILVPKGYTRETAKANSLASFIRNYPMKDDGSEVLLYNGTPKRNQTAHVAVFKLPIENYDLQQCADSVMRMYAEYFWNTKQYDKISFHFVSGFEAKYSKWIQGYRIKLSGNNVNWVKPTGHDTSYESFKEYLKSNNVYLDGGMDVASSFIHRMILDGFDPKAHGRTGDYKTELQELVQRKSGQVLAYEMIGQSGPDHCKTFTAQVTLNGVPIGQGEGHSKKEAEQAAACRALQELKK